jgi:cytochrome P450
MWNELTCEEACKETKGMDAVTVTGTEVRYDPFDEETAADPYPVYRRLRDEAPLYYNEERDFFAVSRFDDVERCLVDRESFISGRGSTYEFIQAVRAGAEIPNGLFIFEDPPLHTAHRALVSRLFTPRRVADLEPQIRQFCARTIDPHVGTGTFDFVKDLGDSMPMRVIGMLLGIPDDDQAGIRSSQRDAVSNDATTADIDQLILGSQIFSDYIDWRAENPSDDIMTQLMSLEIVDETGSTRRLRRDEVLTYVLLINGAGTDTTRRLIGWAGKVLAENPDQRRQLVDDHTLIPNAIDELLRYEPPTYNVARSVAKDVQLHGGTIPAGSALLCLPAAANRDERRFSDPDAFDIHRSIGKIMTFGFGPHLCLGAALARLEARIALEEVLTRFPTWEVDWEHAEMDITGADLRGWKSLPVSTDN